MAEFPALPLWTDAYLGDTTHLTTIEHGAYLLLLITAWRSKTYDLPDDDKMLARFTRLSFKQWLRIRPVIEPYWKVSTGRWSNGRLLDEVEAVRRQAQQRSDAGRASALKRLHRGSTVVQREVNGGATPTPNPTQPIKEESKKNGFHNFVVGGNGLGNGGLSPEDKRSKFHNALAATFDDRVEAWAVIAQAEDATDPRHARALQELKERCLKIGKRWPYSWQ